MSRQTFLFLLLLILFLDFPSGLPDAGLEKNLRVLEQYRDTLKQSQSELLGGDFALGYGNLTGLKLSYEDAMAHRNVLDWPFRKYSALAPWLETQEHSVLPNLVSEKVRSFWAQSPAASGGPSYPLNILSHVYGEFEVLLDLQLLVPMPLELPQYLKEYYRSYRQARYEEQKQRYEEDPENNMPPADLPETPPKAGNISYPLGRLSLHIQPLHALYPDLNLAQLKLDVHEGAALVAVTAEISDSLKRDRNEFFMYAVYFQETGALVGLTRSAKFQGTHGLPHFAMDSDRFHRAKTLVSRLLAVADIDKDVTLDKVTEAVERAATLCEAVLFMQLQKTSFTKEELRYIDDELKLRQGLPLPSIIPGVEADHALLYSPDCGLVFEKKREIPLAGIRAEVQLSQFRRALVGVFLLTMVELNLFMRQAKASRTPSDLSNISTLCIGLLSSYDLIIAVLMMLIMWLSDLYLICACNTVLNILLFYVFELRFFSTVEAAQSNERGASWWQILRGSRETVSLELAPRDLEAQATQGGAQSDEASDSNTSPTAANTNPAPAPATAAAPTANTGTPSGRGPSTYFAFNIVVSFAVSILILNATFWSDNVVRVFEYWLLILLNSYWIPQFLRNTLKNRSKSLQWEFVVGTSLVRLTPLAYLCLNLSNPFRHPRNPILLLVVFSWVSTQILMLYLQSKLGARFWLNSKWLPEQYNYHPVISIKDLESGFSRDIVSNLKVTPDQEVSICESDCAICMSALKFPVLMAENGNKKPLEAMMKEVMITPCYHSFHTGCLEDWMIYKLQCPVCRTALPPV